MVLNTEALGDVDLTGADALETLRAELAEQRHRPGPRPGQAGPPDLLRPSGLLDRIGEDHVFPTLPTALAAFRAAQPET